MDSGGGACVFQQGAPQHILDFSKGIKGLSMSMRFELVPWEKASTSNAVIVSSSKGWGAQECWACSGQYGEWSTKGKTVVYSSVSQGGVGGPDGMDGARTGARF